MEYIKSQFDKNGIKITSGNLYFSLKDETGTPMVLVDENGEEVSYLVAKRQMKSKLPQLRCIKNYCQEDKDNLYIYETT